MSKIFEIYADEAWTHIPPTIKEQNRYWNFFGGISGPQPDLNRLETLLQKIKIHFGNRAEVKWTNIFSGNIACYKAMVDCLFQQLDSSQLRYLQVFLDRKFIYINPASGKPIGPLELQSKIYYQFLKHSFGLKYLPHQNYNVLIHLDRTLPKSHRISKDIC